MVVLDWSQPFEIMCDTSDYVAGAVLGQRREKIFRAIYYVSKTLNDAQRNYSTTEKKISCNASLSFYKERCQTEVDSLGVDKKGSENLAADHLSRLENGAEEENNPIKEIFPNELLLAVSATVPWFDDIVNYIWVEAIATITNDVKVVMKFLHKNNFYRFGTPRVILSNEGTHFCNKVLDALLRKYGVSHKVALAYHPQSNGQAEVSNQEVKLIFEKTLNTNRKDWSQKLDDSLWAYRTAFKTPLGMSP
ncbi:uncharacterized protein LOC133825161 [Humulus lupulus]|uniref:uncharacterized protein LOC133825161 n=1 Tax=Humulus lupulus TaxID=3486 RepID=UPI002B4104E5|nr:uncharacterized protein LOC133825161 [Humulus lupulus]